MNIETPRPSSVIGPYGNALRFADLPLPDPGRWVARRKAEVVAAVRGGLLTLNEACQRYNLTVDEYVSWHQGAKHGGLPALRATTPHRA